jgi:phosphoribosylformimino-5-aminoimidazole carboxamide ribotide isomerase
MIDVIPAVDVLGGEAVRLRQGDYDDVTLRRGDPALVVAELVAAGAALVHVVDLDGARSGELAPALFARLADAAAPARIQASGGVRSVAAAEALLKAGVARVLVATAALTEPGPAAFADALDDRLVVALDVRDGIVVVRGWTASAGEHPEAAAERCAAAGVARLHCTAIERDGTLAGPDTELLRRVVDASGLPVVAAGGIATEAHLAAVAAAGCEAAVVGRALLDGTLPLAVLRPVRAPTADVPNTLPPWRAPTGPAARASPSCASAWPSSSASGSC